MRPIDAKEYSDRLIWMIKYGTYQGVEDALLIALHKLAEMPTLTLDDLRPKGRWLNVRALTTGDGRVRVGDCSCCDSAEKLRNFCPNCGADMRGGGEDA